jgi:site-specific recombinase XerD
VDRTPRKASAKSNHSVIFKLLSRGGHNRRSASSSAAKATPNSLAVSRDFVSERGAPLSAPGFSRMVERTAICAKLGIKAHAHMLRHACGYKLANDGHDTRSLQAYLGHKNIQNTTRYTALAPDRFKGFWRD